MQKKIAIPSEISRLLKEPGAFSLLSFSEQGRLFSRLKDFCGVLQKTLEKQGLTSQDCAYVQEHLVRPLQRILGIFPQTAPDLPEASVVGRLFEIQQAIPLAIALCDRKGATPRNPALEGLFQNFFGDLDIFLSLGEKTSLETVREWVAWTICRITTDSATVKFFPIKETQDMLVYIGNVTHSESVRRWVASAIGNLTATPIEGSIEAKKLFAIEPIREILITMGSVTELDVVREKVAGAVCNIVDDNPDGRALFSTPSTRDFLMSIMTHTESDDVLEWGLRACCFLIYQDKDNQTLFASETMRDFLLRILKDTTHLETVRELAAMSIAYLLYDHEKNQLLFDTPDMQEALIEQKASLVLGKWVTDSLSYLRVARRLS